MHITLRPCRNFRAVAGTRGIAAAAQTDGISQPAIAQTIRKLADMDDLLPKDVWRSCIDRLLGHSVPPPRDVLLKSTG